jgi:hypothetical protein
MNKNEHVGLLVLTNAFPATSTQGKESQNSTQLIRAVPESPDAKEARA